MKNIAPLPWKLEKIQKWPFGVKIIAADNSTVMQQDAVSCSTSQKTREDNENGIGFNGEGVFSKAHAITAIAEQDATAQFIVNSANLAKAIQAIT